MISSGTSAKLTSDVARRNVQARELGVVVGTAADQAAAIKNLVDNYAWPNMAGSKDWGDIQLPPGLLRLDTSLSIASRRGITIQGHGSGQNNQGPRLHNSQVVGGTSLYWAGAGGGGPVVYIDRSAHITLRDFNVYLAETDVANKATLGIHFDKTSLGTSSGKLTLENLVIGNLGARAGTTGFKTGNSPTTTNCDTSLFYDVTMFGIETGYHFMNQHAVEWTFVCPRFAGVDTYWHFERGGHLHVYGLQAQANGLSSDMVVVKIGDVSTNQGMFNLQGGHIDRQAGEPYITLFDLSAGLATNTVCNAVGFHVSPRSVSSVYDGTTPAWVEAAPGAEVNLIGCTLTSQSMVRWRNPFAAGNVALKRDAVVRIVGCIVTHAGGTKPQSGSGFVDPRDGVTTSFGAELVTTLEGGYAGQVIFEQVRHNYNHADFANVTVNVFPVQGTKRTHWDIDNFDGLEFGTTWADSWLGGAKTSSPAWATGTHPRDLAAYYRMDEAVGATTLVDLVNYDDANSGATQPPANDLTIENTQQTDGAPLPYLERWCDWGDQATGFGRDTGLSIDTATQDLTIFGFLQFNEDAGSDTGACVAAVEGSGRFQFLRVATSAIDLQHRRSTAVSIGNFSILRSAPCTFVVTVNATTNVIKTFINGVLVNEGTSDYNGSGTGNLWIGGDNAKRLRGKLSRFGGILAELTNKEATILANAMSVVAERRQFRWS